MEERFLPDLLKIFLLEDLPLVEAFVRETRFLLLAPARFLVDPAPDLLVEAFFFVDLVLDLLVEAFLVLFLATRALEDFFAADRPLLDFFATDPLRALRALVVGILSSMNPALYGPRCHKATLLHC